MTDSRRPKNGRRYTPPPIRGTTDAHVALLKHIRYDEDNDEVIVDRPLKTTLGSLHLGDQHTITSGGEMVFFRNESSNTNYFPLTGGVPDHSVVANQAIAEISPKGRVYGNYFEYETNGALGSEDVLFDSVTSVAADVSTHGFDLVFCEPVLFTDVLKYEVFYGDGTGGIQTYEQIIRRTAIPAKVPYSWWFEHPFDITTSSVNIITRRLTKNGMPVYVKSGLTNPTIAYSKFKLRYFTNEYVAFTGDLHGADKVVSPDGLKTLLAEDDKLTYEDDVLQRMSIDTTQSFLASPDGLQFLTVNDAGMYYNYSRIRTQAFLYTVANFAVTELADVVIGALTGDIVCVVPPTGVTEFTVRDLSANIGTYTVTLVFIEGTDELILSIPHDFVRVAKHEGDWYYYNFRNGKGQRIST